jgi:pimeloyl-ACP methyl ester carboxylesterase
VNGPTDGWLVRDGISLHYLEWNADPATSSGRDVLLLHGLSSNAHYWDRVATRLASGRRIVALDQRGHGLTGRPPNTPAVPDGFAMDRLIEDAKFVSERLGLQTPVVAGHSWGATVSLELAVSAADAISGLVFIDGPIQSAANWFSWEEAQRFMQPPLPRYSSFAQAVEDSRRDFDGAWRDDLEPFVMSRVMQDGDELVLTLTAPVRLALLRGLFDSPVDHLWSVLDVPAVALLAKQGPAAITARREGGASALAKSAPHVEVKWFDTPHDIPVFEPEAIAREIARLSDSELPAAEQLQK